MEAIGFSLACPIRRTCVLLRLTPDPLRVVLRVSVSPWFVSSALLPCGLHELQAAGGDVGFGGEEVSPDAGGSGQFGEGPTERVDREPPVVVHRAERAEGFF